MKPERILSECIAAANKGKSRKQRHKKAKVDRQIGGQYKMWKPVQDLLRSFFVWRGSRTFSHKENEIAIILKGMNLRFYREVSFDLSKRFDFYIPLVDLVIEYDGQQHFTRLDQIRNDVEKDKLIKKIGVKLIRYNKTHDLAKQIAHDLIYHPCMVNNNK